MSTQIIITSKQLWDRCAPLFNFELDEPELLAEALRRKFVVKTGEDQYVVNENYEGYNEEEVA
jgi:hypothetical protein|tara:strand:- start:734 stop:922 length:189 start_codon:yes stop_codon:yes gene_type:complete